MWRIDSDNELHHLAGPKDIVWVPSDQMVVYRADLPLKSKQVWEKTVPFVVEDQLLNRVETMHFAIGQMEEDEGIPVICTPLSAMREWMDSLAERGIKPRVVYPDFLAIPFDQDTERPVLWCQNDYYYLRFGLQETISGSLEWVRSIVEVKSYGADLRIFSDNPQSLPEDWRVRVESSPHSLEELMIQAANQSLPVSLLQGAFKPTSLILTWLKPWYWAAMLLLVLAALFLAELRIKAYSFNVQAATLEKATERIFAAYFPDEQLGGANVRVHLSRLLDRLQNEVVERKAGPWRLMLTMEPIFSSCAACEVERIKLDSKVLKMEVSTSKNFNSVMQEISKLPNIKVGSEPLSARENRKKVRLILETEGKV